MCFLSTKVIMSSAKLLSWLVKADKNRGTLSSEMILLFVFPMTYQF